MRLVTRTRAFHKRDPEQYGDAVLAREGGGASSPDAIARCGATLRTPPTEAGAAE
jgi:hypothetical protein